MSFGALQSLVHQHLSLPWAGTKGVILAGGVSSTSALMLAEITQIERPWLIVLSTILAGVIGSGLVGWAKLIAARSAARDSESVRVERETAKVIERINNSWELQVAYHRAQARQYRQIAGLERISKHKVQGAYNNVTIQLAILREKWRAEKGEDPLPNLQVPNYADLVGEDDAVIQELLAENEEKTT